MLRSSETQIALGRRRPRSRSAAAAKRIITSGPHTIATACSGIEAGARRSSARDDADAAAPVRVGRVDGHLDVDVERARQARARRVEQLGGRAAAVQDAHAPVALAVRRAASWTTGRSGARPMPPATTTTSRPSAAASGQAVPNGPRTPSDVAGLARAQIARGDGADRAHRVHERAAPADRR